MKKIKDLIYDYNDIFLALIIIVVAAGVIFWQVTDIMAYPTFAKNSSVEESSEITIDDIDTNPIEVDPIVEPGEDITGEDTSDTSDKAQTTEEEQSQESAVNTTTKDTTFEVRSGEYLSNVANNLKNQGLINDSSEFIKLVEELKLDMKIQVGTFTIPAGSSEEDIAHIITRTN